MEMWKASAGDEMYGSRFGCVRNWGTPRFSEAHSYDFFLICAHAGGILVLLDDLPQPLEVFVSPEEELSVVCKLAQLYGAPSYPTCAIRI